MLLNWRKPSLYLTDIKRNRLPAHIANNHPGNR
ncbi:hypothetical protein NB707_002570 [Pantoea ananatis]|nr:hypothetical protein [Pantoea ananatis]